MGHEESFPTSGVVKTMIPSNLKYARLDKDKLVVDLNDLSGLLGNICPFAKGSYGSECCSIAFRETKSGSHQELRCPDRSADFANVSAPLDCPLRRYSEIAVRSLKSFEPGDVVYWGKGRKGLVIRRNIQKGTLLVSYQPDGGVKETTVLLQEKECSKA